MALTDTWDASFEASPSGTDDVADGDNRIRELKRALRERKEKSHYIRDTNNIYGAALTDDEEGRNIPGNTPAVFIGTLAAINALTGLEAINGGELAFDTDSDILRVHNGSDWTTRTISSDVTGGPIISAAELFGNVVQSGWSVNPITNQADLTELTNGDDVALATTGTTTTSALGAVTIDLGSVHQGTVKFLASITNIQASLSMAGFFGTGSITAISQQGLNILLTHVWTGGSGPSTYSFIQPFYGRQIGFAISAVGATSINLQRLEIHGVAV